LNATAASAHRVSADDREESTERIFIGIMRFWPSLALTLIFLGCQKTPTNYEFSIVMPEFMQGRPMPSDVPPHRWNWYSTDESTMVGHAIVRYPKATFQAPGELGRKLRSDGWLESSNGVFKTFKIDGNRKIYRDKSDSASELAFAEVTDDGWCNVAVFGIFHYARNETIPAERLERILKALTSGQFAKTGH